MCCSRYNLDNDIAAVPNQRGMHATRTDQGQPRLQHIAVYSFPDIHRTLCIQAIGIRSGKRLGHMDADDDAVRKVYRYPGQNLLEGNRSTGGSADTDVAD